MAIPTSFNANGVLDPGTYLASFSDIRNSILVNGDGSSTTWDKKWRASLVDQAEVLVKQLFLVGFTDVFLDGSFVENKDHPNDVDGYFDTKLSALSAADVAKFVKLISGLNNIDPFKVWTWNPNFRQQVPGFTKKQLPMWVKYRVELYPHLHNSAQPTGIKDAAGNDLQFPSAFRQSRHNFSPKGIIQISSAVSSGGTQ